MRDEKDVAPETEITPEMAALVAWEESSDPHPKGAVIAIYRSMKSLEPLKKAQ